MSAVTMLVGAVIAVFCLTCGAALGWFVAIAKHRRPPSRFYLMGRQYYLAGFTGTSWDANADGSLTYTYIPCEHGRFWPSTEA